MGDVQLVTVSSFLGIHQPGLLDRVSVRRDLDKPRELVNFHLTDDGHLYMPKSAEVFYEFPEEEGFIRTIHFCETPRGHIIQMSEGKIYFIPRGDTDWPDPITVKHVATIPEGERQWNLWVNGIGSEGTLFGYAPRGSAGPVDGKTWRLHGDRNNPDTEDLTDVITPTASYSTLYKGRRFWVKRGRSVYFSNLNDFTSPRDENNSFPIGGDDSGDGWITNPGFVNGMVGWEDLLIFFMIGSIWNLTGGSPEHWQLRQATTVTGNSNPFSLTPTDYGVLSYSGTNVNNRGIFLFTGDTPVKISRLIDEYMKSPGRMVGCTVSGHHAIFSASRVGADNRQYLVYNFETGQWVSFDGFEQGTADVFNDGIFLSGKNVLYFNFTNNLTRFPGRGAKGVFGYHDDGNPTGMNRYMGVKLSGRKWGTGNPTVKVTARTPEGNTVVSSPVELSTNVFDSVLIPLNIRGNAIEFTLEVTPVNDDNEVSIETMQLVVSSKGDKLSRV